jgi:hypothetical protein
MLTISSIAGKTIVGWCGSWRVAWIQDELEFLVVQGATPRRILRVARVLI